MTSGSDRPPIPGDVVRQVGGVNVHRIHGLDYLSPSTALGLSPFGRLPDIPAHVMEYLRARGEAVGIGCALEAEGALDWSSVDRKILPFLEAFRDFRQASGFVFEDSEALVLNRTLGLFGYTDLRGTCDGEPITLEIKTSADSYTSHVLQLCAYTYPSTAGVVLYLRKNGTFHTVRPTEDDLQDCADVARLAHRWVREQDAIAARKAVAA